MSGEIDLIQGTGQGKETKPDNVIIKKRVLRQAFR